MNAEDRRDEIFRRVMVVLDTSTASRALLDFAADLAAYMGVSLAGVYIEDTDIAEFAELPFAREISLSGARVRDLSRKRMQAHFRAEAARVREAFEAAGRARRLACEFEIRRGRFEVELAAVAGERDLLAVSGGGGPVVRPRGHDILGRLETSAAVGFLACDQRPQHTRAGVTAIFTGSPESEKGVSLAARVAKEKRVPLTIVTVGKSPDNTLRERLVSMAASAPGVDVLAAEGGVGEIVARLRRLSHLVVMPADLAREEQAMLRNLGAPTLLLRRRSAAEGGQG